MSDRSFDEKRNFIRMKINTPVTMHYAGKDYAGLCKDLSGAGMQIETDETFAVGQTLEVTIEQKGGAHVPFKATVEVTRIENSTPDKQVVGLTIREIAE